METATKKVTERRSFTRLPYKKEAHCAWGPSDSGTATLANVGRGGMRFGLDRYIAPGRVIELTFPDIRRAGEPVTLRARIAWSKPAPKSPNEFQTGAHVLYDRAGTLRLASEVFYAALETNRDAAYPDCYQDPEDLLAKISWAS